MRKLLSLMLLAVTVLFTACGSDDEAQTVSFDKSVYALTDGSVSVTLGANFTPGQAQDYPVTFGGTAVKDKDYTVSGEKYVLGGASPVTTIVVTAKNNFDSDKTITMTAGGATTTIKLGKRERMLYSFSQKTYVLGDEVEVEIGLLKASDGSKYVATQDMSVSIEPDASSTAVEGTHYTIENKTATIAAGKTSCTFKIKRTQYEEGKTTIVLKPVLSEENGFVGGQFPTATVDIIGSYVTDLMGEWTVYKVVNDKDYWKSTWFLEEKDLKNIPELNVNDTYTFTSDNGGLVMTTNLQSGYKNYFRDKSAFTIDKEVTFRPGGNYGIDKVTLQMLKLENVNRYFSASQVSDDKVAYVGVRNIKDDNGETMLDLFIIDYEPKDFLSTLADYGYFDNKKPTAVLYSDEQFELILKKKK